MSAKKTSQTKTSTSKKKPRTHFPRVEAALAGPPLTEGTAEPTAEAVLFGDAVGTTIPEPGPAGPAPAATGMEDLVADAGTTGEATAGDATPSEAHPPGLVIDDGITAAEAQTTETLPESSGESPMPQTTTEPPTAETTATEAMTEGMAPAESAETVPDAPDTGKKQRQPRATKTKSSDGQTKKLSALNAAAQVLIEAGQPMGCQEMIAAMATKGYWTSPSGKTPDATLYSALQREITTKDAQARFVKAAPGQFALRPTA